MDWTIGQHQWIITNEQQWKIQNCHHKQPPTSPTQCEHSKHQQWRLCCIKRFHHQIPNGKKINHVPYCHPIMVAKKHTHIGIQYQICQRKGQGYDHVIHMNTHSQECMYSIINPGGKWQDNNQLLRIWDAWAATPPMLNCYTKCKSSSTYRRGP